jgi:phage-related protein
VVVQVADGTLIFDTKLDSSGVESGVSALGGKLSGVMGTALKGTGVAIGAAVAGVSALTKSSLDAYADFEQLTGGVETLFKTSADKVMEYADEAYKSAGLSANEYMETVTSFSASLLQGLGGDTDLAADVANQAIIDMSDNANKMGSDMSAIQNAYQGFAKQNFTMLDNLKLGYGGTKEEMQRLLDDAEKLQKEKFGVDVEYDMNNFADVIQAIHTVQEEMDIAGTTSKEAATTIQGSLGMMKGAWQNLVTGLGDENADLDGLIDNFIQSVITVGENIMPEVEKILTGIGEMVTTMLPEVINMIPDLINSVLPGIIESASNLVTTLCTAIIDNAPTLIDSALQLVLTLTDALLQNLPMLIECGLQAIVQLALGIAQALPTLIPTIVEVVLSIVEYLIDNVDLLIDAAIALITGLAEGLINALPVLIEKAPVIIEKLVVALVTNAPKLLEAAVKVIETLATGLITNVPKLLAKIPQIMTSLKNGFLNLCSGFADVGKNIIDGLWNGIQSGWNWLTDKVSNLAKGLLDAAKSALGIASPSKEFRKIGEFCVAGFNDGIDDLMDGNKLASNINASLGTIQANVSGGQINGVGGGYTQVINVNREISTPDELARAVRLESRYGLMKGVAFG